MLFIAIAALWSRMMHCNPTLGVVISPDFHLENCAVTINMIDHKSRYWNESRLGTMVARVFFVFNNATGTLLSKVVPMFQIWSIHHHKVIDEKMKRVRDRKILGKTQTQRWWTKYIMLSSLSTYISKTGTTIGSHKSPSKNINISNFGSTVRNVNDLRSSLLAYLFYRTKTSKIDTYGRRSFKVLKCGFSLFRVFNDRLRGYPQRKGPAESSCSTGFSYSSGGCCTTGSSCCTL